MPPGEAAAGAFPSRGNKFTPGALALFFPPLGSTEARALQLFRMPNGTWLLLYFPRSHKMAALLPDITSVFQG